jgi:hypothetical protein
MNHPNVHEAFLWKLVDFFHADGVIDDAERALLDEYQGNLDGLMAGLNYAMKRVNTRRFIRAGHVISEPQEAA